MPFDEVLADRVRPLLRGRYSVTEKKMFGGLAFMVNGHMCCGIVSKDLVVRTGPKEFDAALSQPHARPMDFTGRPMKGFVFVAPAGYRHRSDRDLKARTRRGLDFVLLQPPKWPTKPSLRETRFSRLGGGAAEILEIGFS